MKRIQKKLCSQRGETLVELMVSILIATLSVGLLLGGVAVSVNINRQAQKADTYFYETLSLAESQKEPLTDGIAPKPTIDLEENAKTIRIPVQVFGGTGLYTYALDTAGGVLP